MAHGAPPIGSNDEGQRFATFVQVGKQTDKDKDTSWPEYGILYHASELEKDPAKQARWHEGIGKAVHRAGNEHISTHYRSGPDGTQLSELGERIKTIYEDWLEKESTKEEKEQYRNTAPSDDADKYYQRDPRPPLRVAKRTKSKKKRTRPERNPGQ